VYRRELIGTSADRGVSGLVGWGVFFLIEWPGANLREYQLAILCRHVIR
jgi:hypothetical protein